MTPHPSAERVRVFAEARGLELAIREYPEDGARTADDAAAAVGCAVDQIVKSMIFSAEIGDDRELILALTAGSNKVDGKALAAIAGADSCGRADPEAVRAVTGYAIGGVPPFGHRQAVRTWIDPHLLTFDEVWAAAGTPRHVFPIAPTDLVAITRADPVDFTA
jgi:Cys-tRNA(Pro) deacylase